jgi:hypothetical protein
MEIRGAKIVGEEIRFDTSIKTEYGEAEIRRCMFRFSEYDRPIVALAAIEYEGKYDHKWFNGFKLERDAHMAFAYEAFRSLWEQRPELMRELFPFSELRQKDI